jgi:hypothetical protein
VPDVEEPVSTDALLNARDYQLTAPSIACITVSRLSLTAAAVAEQPVPAVDTGETWNEGQFHRIVLAHFLDEAPGLPA